LLRLKNFPKRGERVRVGEREKKDGQIVYAMWEKKRQKAFGVRDKGEKKKRTLSSSPVEFGG